MILGPAVTSATLKTDARYRDATATATLLSSYALEQRGSTDFEVMKVVNGMKDEYASGASTLLRVFNASGGRLFLRSDVHWHGKVWKYPLDLVIENGQWSIALVVHAARFEGVAGGIVYRTEEVPTDIFCGWDVPFWDGPFSSSHKNTVCAEIRKPGHYDAETNLGIMRNLTNGGGASARAEHTGKAEERPFEVDHDYVAVVLTAAGTSPVTDIVIGRSDTLQ
ncbi:hypothetical protein [Methylobacterium indicum]|uniref:hypothetical protein n=1 Tax=Methylobacterium indicum TaxID=1775910 RepID=UPI000A7B3BB3|nr:hypothetical protein [Methylobacterium indicum]